jgi:hypothetical protein
MATGRVPTTANSPLTAKGDLFGYSTTQARVAVGNDGETLVADSSTSTGLRYNPSQAAAKNILINGEMSCWQRGTSFSVVAFDYRYTADRWLTFNGAACTISQETSTVPSGSQYALKVTGGASTSGYEMWQVIETANAIGLAGQTATLSAYATGTTGSTCTVTLDYSTGTDTASTGSWTAISPASSATTLTSGTFSRITTTVSVPSTAKSLRVRISSSSLTSGQFQIYGKAQLELGSVPTTFTRAGGTIQGELAACKYYFRRYGGNSNFEGFGIAQATSTTNASMFMLFETGMRATPTGAYAAASNFVVSNTTGSGTACTSISTDVLSKNGATLVLVGGALAAGNATYVRANNSSSATIDFSAEL